MYSTNLTLIVLFWVLQNAYSCININCRIAGRNSWPEINVISAVVLVIQEHEVRLMNSWGARIIQEHLVRFTTSWSLKRKSALSVIFFNQLFLKRTKTVIFKVGFQMVSWTYCLYMFDTCAHTKYFHDYND